MSPRAPARSLVAPLLVLGLAVSGCGRMREVSECRSLAKDVNATLDEVEALNKTPSLDQKASMAKRYGELAKRLEPRAQGTTPLATALHDYVTLLRATETALRNHIEASKNQSPARLNEAKRELERLSKREKALVTRLDVECHS